MNSLRRRRLVRARMSWLKSRTRWSMTVTLPEFNVENLRLALLGDAA